jgi:hypothetical protein
MKILGRGRKMDFFDLDEKTEHFRYILYRLNEVTLLMLIAFELNNMNFVYKYTKEMEIWMFLIDYFHSNQVDMKET